MKRSRMAIPFAGRLATLAALAGAAVLAAAPARADHVADAGIQCQVEYGSRSELAVACLRGVKLAARATDTAAEAIDECAQGFEDGSMRVACRRGVALHTRLANANPSRGNDDATFSYSWKPKRGAAQVNVGDYRLFVGDAERSIDECMRAYEGASTPPSCLSGLSAQRKPPK